MASMRDIKRRRTSVQSTQQITKAMKLVSTVKLQKARTRAEESKPYFDCMYATMTSLLAKAGNINHPYLKADDSKKKAVIVVTSNRGLAGGYNSNVVKMVTENEAFTKENIRIYAIGGKGLELLKHKGYDIVADYSEMIEEPSYDDAKSITKRLLTDFENGEIGEIYLIYTFFKNTVSHIPTMIKVLPAEVQEEAGEEDAKAQLTPMNFEPEAEEAISLLVPKYISSILYGAFVEAVASENGARMQAMDSATSNAEEMIDDLELKYNRARQGAITQELTEICYYKKREATGFQLEEDFLDLLNEDIDMVFLCSPDNPTGKLIDRGMLWKILARCETYGIRMVLDECFIDFAENAATASILADTKRWRTLFILRSLTKMHAIPGIRIGYAVTSDMEFLEKMEQSRQPWSVSIPAQAAGMASLKERMRVKRTCDFTNRERIWMENELDKLGITHYPSDANFILMRSGINLYEKLKKQKILVRDCSNYKGLGEGYYRVCMRQRGDNQKLIDALGEILYAGQGEF